MMEYTIKNVSRETALCVGQILSGYDDDGRTLLVALRNKDINEAIINTANGLTKIKWNYTGPGTTDVALHITSDNVKCYGTIPANDMRELFDPWIIVF